MADRRWAEGSLDVRVAYLRADGHFRILPALPTRLELLDLSLAFGMQQEATVVLAGWLQKRGSHPAPTADGAERSLC